MNQNIDNSQVGTIIKHFDGQAVKYRKKSESGFWQYIRQHEAECVLEMTGSPRGLDFLDLGTGAGYYANLFAARGAASVHAVDLSAKMIQQLPRQITGHVGDITTINLGMKFSRIVCAGALEFLDDPAAVFNNARRHAAAGATFVILAPKNNLAGHIYQKFHRRHGVSVSLFKHKDLATFADSTGWHLKAIKSVFPFALVAAFKEDH